MHKAEEGRRKFQASLKGINLEEEKEGPSFEEVRMRALGITTSKDDVVSLQGEFANEAGFGIGAGLGYFKE
jgi:hypothetical protein